MPDRPVPQGARPAHDPNVTGGSAGADRPAEIGVDSATAPEHLGRGPENVTTSGTTTIDATSGAVVSPAATDGRAVTAAVPAARTAATTVTVRRAVARIVVDMTAVDMTGGAGAVTIGRMVAANGPAVTAVRPTEGAIRADADVTRTSVRGARRVPIVPARIARTSRTCPMTSPRMSWTRPSAGS